MPFYRVVAEVESNNPGEALMLCTHQSSVLVIHVRIHKELWEHRGETSKLDNVSRKKVDHDLNFVG